MRPPFLGWGLLGSGLALVVVGVVLVAVSGDGSRDAAPAAVTSTSEIVTPTHTAPATVSETPVATSSVVATSLPPSSAATSTTGASSSTTTTVPDAALLARFFPELSAAIRAADASFLTAHLHPFVVDRYGAAACAEYLAGLAPSLFDMQVVGAAAAGPWEWQTDGLSRPVEGATTVTVRRTDDGAEFTTAQTHVAIGGDRVVRWFTDCGTPLPGAP